VSASRLRVVLASLLPRDERANALGLGYLKAYAESRPELRSRVRIRIADLPMDEDAAGIARSLCSDKPDLLGFHVQLCNEDAVTAVAAEAKRLRPGVRIVLGGQEASLHPERLLAKTAADWTVLGEGELTFAALLRSILRGAPPDRVRGLASLRDGALFRTGERAPVRDLSRIPSPYLYSPVPAAWSGIGRSAIETTRGCPFSCAFCSWPNDVRPRHFPLRRVRRELREILRLDPGTLVHFADPNLFLNKTRARAILRAIRAEDSGEKARYWFNTYFGDFDESMAALCDHPGFILEAGVQTTNPAALRAAGRRLDKDSVKRGIDLLRRRAPRARLTVQLILGLPGDDLRGFLKSLEWGHGLSVDEVQVFPMQLFPETRFHREAARWKVRANPEPPYEVRRTAGFSPQDLREGRKAALRLSFFKRHPEAWHALGKAGGREPLWKRAKSLAAHGDRRFGIGLGKAMEAWERKACDYLTPVAAGPDPIEAERVAEAARDWLGARKGRPDRIPPAGLTHGR